MAVNRIPGEKMYIDWVGDQPELLTDTETGEIKKVHICDYSWSKQPNLCRSFFQTRNFRVL